MARKMYWVQYHGLANRYELMWTDNEVDRITAREQGFDHITRKEAITLARQERERAEYDTAFSGYADDHIWPFKYRGNLDFVDAHCRDRAYVIEA